MAALVSLLCTSPAARAGNWTVEYEVSGVASGNAPLPDYSGFYSTPTQWNNLLNNGALYLPPAGDYASSPGTATATNVGSVQAFAVWHPNTNPYQGYPGGNGTPSPPDLPPVKVTFFEMATVSGFAGGGDSPRGDINTNRATFTLQNPLGGETFTSPDGRFQTQSGTAWTTIDNSSRALRVPLGWTHF